VEIFIARQPILDTGRTVRAYELLFRDSLQNTFSAHDGTEATRQVMVNGFIHFGMPMLTGGRRAFINITREVLLREYVLLFPKTSVVAEILEVVEPDAETVGACRHLKENGYTIALDDFAQLEGYEALLELADIVKIDLRATNAEQRHLIVQRARQINRRIQLLAEKVETHEELNQALDEGFTLFQGYFFAKPEILHKKEVPGNKLQYLRLLGELHRPELDIEHLEALIRNDVSLSYRLLRYINSAFFGWRSEIRSLKHALVLLGERDIRKWASLVALSCLGEDKPLALLITGLTRARFAEMVAAATGMAEQADHLFLVGAFSVIDAILDRPLSEALSGLAIPAEVHATLLGKPGPARERFELVIAYEQADWSRLSSLAHSIGMEEARIPEMYAGAVSWAEKSFSAPIESVRPPEAS
jgi:c-di-GMP-related signal transduction protein